MVNHTYKFLQHHYSKKKMVNTARTKQTKTFLSIIPGISTEKKLHVSNGLKKVGFHTNRPNYCYLKVAIFSHFSRAHKNNPKQLNKNQIAEKHT